jgi:hypothetical protein
MPFSSKKGRAKASQKMDAWKTENGGSKKRSRLSVRPFLLGVL